MTFPSLYEVDECWEISLSGVLQMIIYANLVQQYLRLIIVP
jgi:hypothetical protein